MNYRDNATEHVQHNATSAQPPQHPFSWLSPVVFLQAFLNELLHVCDRHGLDNRDDLIEQIGLQASESFEAAYRLEFNCDGTFDHEQYADLIVKFKNRIGGSFSLASSDQDCIRVINSRCPFGNRVKEFPELCHMTSSVFGGIAARNFGYAKVELRKRIATHDGECEVCIHTNPQSAALFAGTEYRAEGFQERPNSPVDRWRAIGERMKTVWCPSVASGRTKAAPSYLMIAQSPSMHGILQAIEQVGPTTATVLITGETGTGKEVVARAMHALSERWNRNFVAVNCGAIPDNLLESTLFGHEKGAFTGAFEVHHGLFQRAEGGTLFLDEINALSLAMQVKLLRVLQEGEYERVGGKQTLTADVRIIAASNKSLEHCIAAGEFRQDLYYRLNVVELHIPPLRERVDDIAPLVDHILCKLREKYHKPIHSVSHPVMQRLLSYRWPGNIRELENVIERGFLFATGSRLEHVELPKSNVHTEAAADFSRLSWRKERHHAVTEVERRLLSNALAHFNGDVKQMAQWMGLTPRAVYIKLGECGLQAAHYRDRV